MVYTIKEIAIDNFEPRIVAFFCNWCSYAGADLAGVSRLKCPPNIRIIRVMCSGGVSDRFILKALALGADGVLVCGCHPGDCHYTKGNLNARRRVLGLKPFLKAMGINSERVRLEWIGASEATKLVETAKSFTQTIKNLGPSQLNRNRSCSHE